MVTCGCGRHSFSQLRIVIIVVWSQWFLQPRFHLDHWSSSSWQCINIGIIENAIETWELPISTSQTSLLKTKTFILLLLLLPLLLLLLLLILLLLLLPLLLLLLFFLFFFYITGLMSNPINSIGAHPHLAAPSASISSKRRRWRSFSVKICIKMASFWIVLTSILLCRKTTPKWRPLLRIWEKKPRWRLPLFLLLLLALPPPSLLIPPPPLAHKPQMMVHSPEHHLILPPNLHCIGRFCCSAIFCPSFLITIDASSSSFTDSRD